MTRLPQGHEEPKGCERSQGGSPERDLRQGSKAALSNYPIEESNSITEELPTRGDWLMMECLL